MTLAAEARDPLVDLSVAQASYSLRIHQSNLVARSKNLPPLL